MNGGLAAVGEPNIAAVGALMGDPARCRILLALSDGRQLPASQLAAEAGVGAATASSHLRKLATAGLVTVERVGRYRYYRLAGADVAFLIETLEYFAPKVPPRSPRQMERAQELREARICYDHLAGRVGVHVMASMVARGNLTEERLTPQGAEFLAGLGIECLHLRAAVHHHADATERKPHIYGAVGTVLLDRFVALDWIGRPPVGRSVFVTPAGRAGFGLHFDVEFPESMAV